MLIARTVVACCLALVGAACTAQPSGTAAASARAADARVVRVIDGDTVVLQIGAEQERVRLIGMDTPERKDPLGPQATAFVRALLPVGTAVSYVTDVDIRDRYDRMLAYVWVGAAGPPNTMLNARIVEAGWARIMTIPPNVRHVDLFLRLQREARAAKRGMWAIEPFDDRS